MFNHRPGHILRGSMLPATPPDSRHRPRAAFSAPPSHHQPWPWRCDPDFRHGCYADGTAWLDDDDPGPFGLPAGRVSPRRTSERSLSPPGPAWSPPEPTHRGGPSSPIREWDLPEVFSPPAVSTPAYSVEEPATPTRPAVFPAPRHRRRRSSSRRFHSPSPDRLPPRTQRCETLPSSTPSPQPESPRSPPRRADHHLSSSFPFHHHNHPFHTHNHPSSPFHTHESSSFHPPPPRQLLLAAHQRTRRHLRALERELARLQLEERRWGRDGGWGEW